MDRHNLHEFAVCTSILLKGVVDCKGFSQTSWHRKLVILRNEDGNDVARGLCQSVDAELVIDMDGKPLGDDRVAIQIPQSLCEEEVLSAWVWSMHSWHIK